MSLTEVLDFRRIFKENAASLRWQSLRDNDALLLLKKINPNKKNVGALTTSLECIVFLLVFEDFSFVLY